MNREKQVEICDYLTGTCKSEFDAADAFDCTDDEVLEAVVEIDEIERCDCCSWWMEKYELDEELLCDDCREDDRDEDE